MDGRRTNGGTETHSFARGEIACSNNHNQPFSMLTRWRLRACPSARSARPRSQHARSNLEATKDQLNFTANADTPQHPQPRTHTSLTEADAAQTKDPASALASRGCVRCTGSRP
eukprot:1037361-Prymnesium_polylepis.1